jgi:hypothetical protein
MNLDFQKKAELKAIVKTMAKLSKHAYEVAVYSFSDKGVEDILALYKKMDDFEALGNEKKKKEILEQITSRAFLIAGLIKKLENDKELKDKVKKVLPEFETNFKRLKKWVELTGVSKSLDEMVKWVEEHAEELTKNAEKDPFFKELINIYKKEGGV